MQTANSPLTKKSWAKMFAQPAQEFSPTILPIKSGNIPEGLRGSLYRNGAARLERGGVRMGHWFDGDGAVLAVHFTNEGATGVYRYVQTKAYQEESAADKLIYCNYGTLPPGKIWNRLFTPIKNCANISVLALPDKLLALWEAGHPYALDPETLETWGVDTLGGVNKKLVYSAHPKREPQTGEIFNFGISGGPNFRLNLYKSDTTGKILKKSTFKLDGFPILHDFLLAGTYLVFFVPPARIDPLAVFTRLNCVSDAVQWKPHLGTQILIFDRQTLTLISRSKAEPWFQWHFGNGYVDATGTIILDFVRYPDFAQINQLLKDVITDRYYNRVKCGLWQAHLNPQTGKLIALDEVLDRNCEFPIVPASQVGQPWRHTYLSLYRRGSDMSQEYFNAIAHLDYQTGKLKEAAIGENLYPTEPIYAPDSLNPQQGWILSVVYDGNSHTSEVWIFDSDRLDEPPVCRLGLPSVVPASFHGTWKAA